MKEMAMADSAQRYLPVPLTQDKPWRRMALREPRLLGDTMGVARREL